MQFYLQQLSIKHKENILDGKPFSNYCGEVKKKIFTYCSKWVGDVDVKPCRDGYCSGLYGEPGHNWGCLTQLYNDDVNNLPAEKIAKLAVSLDFCIMSPMEDIYKWYGGKWLGLVHLDYYNIRFIYFILFFQKNWMKSWGTYVLLSLRGCLVSHFANWKTPRNISQSVLRVQRVCRCVTIILSGCLVFAHPTQCLSRLCITCDTWTWRTLDQLGTQWNLVTGQKLSKKRKTQNIRNFVQKKQS